MKYIIKGDSMKTGIGVGIVMVVIVAVLVLVSAWLIMLLVNIVLGHYDVKTLDYVSALAIALLATGLGFGSRSNSK